MRIHTDEAWSIASQYSYTLASDTRTLAAQIDDLVDKKLELAATEADNDHMASSRTSDQIRLLKRQAKQ